MSQSDIAEQRWQEARERMRRSVDAVLWQELGVPSPERERYVDWILDRIFKDEYVAALRDDWSLWRQDDNGNHFRIQSGLSYPEAKEMVRDFEARGHKQFYWMRPTEA